MAERYFGRILDSRKSMAAIFGLILSTLLLGGSATIFNGKPLHLHMNKAEVEHYFGASDHSQVPEYDVVLPFHSNDDGEFISFNLRGGGRQRRSLNDLHRPNYKLRAFGKDLHLKLVRNDRLMAPGLRLEKVFPDGRTSRSAELQNTFYLGHVASDPNSMVAVSNDEGLKGLIRHEEDAMFIQPLPDHLAKHFRTKADTHPHLIHKAMNTENTDAEDKPDMPFLGPGLYSDKMPEIRAKRAASNVLNVDAGYKLLEVAFVADNLMAEQLRGGNISNHLLLMGNIVAGMFRDESIGKVKVVVMLSTLQVVHYDKLPGANENSTNGEKFLAFENYTRNTKNIKRHDVAVFFASNSVGGLALHRGVCRTYQPAALVGVKNAALQIVGGVAHEIGHTLGLDHDKGEKCPPDTFIMSATLPGGTKAYTWSPCSRMKLQEFLKSPKSSCLDDPVMPIEQPSSWQNILPGEIVGPDQQCEYQNGKGSLQCRRLQDSCGSLFCSRGGKGCFSRKLPALDGSICGERKWCIKGHCVDNGLPYIDGGWTEWSDFVPCTMECGGGVTYRERTCTNPPPQHGGDLCEGDPEGHYKICNPQPCTEGHKSYREKACEEWDPTAIPHYVTKEPCKVYCIKPGESQARKIHETAKDGARCTPFSQELDVCIEGECRAVGCDHQLGSGTKNDLCGVCAGNRTSCSLQSGTFTENVPLGVNKAALIVELPIGTSWSLFLEMGLTRNKIGLQNSSGTFLIDPKSRKSRIIQAAGAKVAHSTTGPDGSDQLQIIGPTNAVLRIMYIRIERQNQNPGVQYAFYKPLEAGSPASVNAVFEWKVPNGDEWSACSAECAGGSQTRRVYCAKSGEPRNAVGDQWCRGSKPDSERECNVEPCKPEWHLSKWGGCSKTCGKGVQTRSLSCRQKVKDLGFQQVSEDLCDLSTKPNTREFQRACRKIKCPPVWKPQAWSQCSTSCDTGVETREVLCVETSEEGVDVVVPDILCQADRPPSQQACNLDNTCAPSETACPAVSLCQNGATCVDDPAGYKCSCPAGYKGYFCEEQIDPCDSSPCLNGATCLQDDSDFLKYTCYCPIGYTGEECEVRINPCDSGPCLNGGVCVPDEDVVLDYSCNCSTGYSGDTCEVPPSYGVACLKYDKKIYSIKLGDVKKILDWKDTMPAIDLCRKLAHAKGLKNFAIGSLSQCVGMPNKEISRKRKSSAGCLEGVGKKKSVFAYTFEKLPNYTDLGCYNERSKKKATALEQRLAELGSRPNGANLPSTVEQCAIMARDAGYSYFAVVNRKICVSSKNAQSRYNMHGEITENVEKFCKNGVGLGTGSMEVYRFDG